MTDDPIRADNGGRKLSDAISSFLHPDSLPSVWCPGCGIGTVVNTFIRALSETDAYRGKLKVVSGIGCTGKVTGYMKLDSIEIPDGSVMKYASELAQEPDMKVVAFLNNADLLVADPEEFMEAGRKKANILVIHINNLIYCITENELLPTTPFIRSTMENDHGLPFNMPRFAARCGAGYVARWTPLRAGWLKYSIMEAMSRAGLSVIEMISPCVIYHTNNGMIGDPVDRLRFYHENSIMKQFGSTDELDLRDRNRIIIGKFVDERED